MTTLLDFWEAEGKTYNVHRHRAVQLVQLMNSFEETIEHIKQETGKAPIVIATSARSSERGFQITYTDQELIWKQDRPVLLLLGTGSGLSEELLKRCDYLLGPIKGLSDFNHLSVRSAAAVIFDRWLGINLKKH